jgi:hypothetical protein
MLLYTIQTSGERDENTEIPLPKIGQRNEVAHCMNGDPTEWLQGTGDGWRRITRDEADAILS